MERLLGVVAVGALVVIFGGMFLAGGYNRLAALRNRYKNAFSQIDVQLKRRYDLIPNLVETAKGYMQHERETLEAVIQARNAAATAAEAPDPKPCERPALGNLFSAASQAPRAPLPLLPLVRCLSRPQSHQEPISPPAPPK